MALSNYKQVSDALFLDRQGVALDEWVTGRRQEDKSWRRISTDLRDLTDGLLDVTPQTLINWHGDADRAGQDAA